MKEIKLNHGKVALVDDADYKWLNQWKWHADKSHCTCYARRSNHINGEKSNIRMHRLILGLSDPDVICDHIDGNGLNNQRSNLRICTASQNAMNQRVRRDSKTGFRGVSWDKNNLQWQAKIAANGKDLHLGRYNLIDDAISARKAAEKIYHGEFARNANIIQSI